MRRNGEAACPVPTIAHTPPPRLNGSFSSFSNEEKAEGVVEGDGFHDVAKPDDVRVVLFYLSHPGKEGVPLETPAVALTNLTLPSNDNPSSHSAVTIAGIIVGVVTFVVVVAILIVIAVIEVRKRKKQRYGKHVLLKDKEGSFDGFYSHAAPGMESSSLK